MGEHRTYLGINVNQNEIFAASELFLTLDATYLP
jgi:hypothetical protein